MIHHHPYSGFHPHNKSLNISHLGSFMRSRKKGLECLQQERRNKLYMCCDGGRGEQSQFTGEKKSSQ